jgi:hypothetical protein
MEKNISSQGAEAPAEADDSDLDLSPLMSNCDRKWENESRQHIVNIAASAIYWSKRENKALREQLEQAKADCQAPLPRFVSTEIPAARIQAKYREHWPESVPTIEQIEGIQHVVEVLTPVPQVSGSGLSEGGEPLGGNTARLPHCDSAKAKDSQQPPPYDAALPEFTTQPIETRRFVFDDFCEQCSHEAACAIKGGCSRESTPRTHQAVFCQKHNAELNTLPATAYCLICENEKKSAAPRPQEPRRELISAIESLLEWVPKSGKGSSGYLRVERVKAALQFFTPAQSPGPRRRRS